MIDPTILIDGEKYKSVRHIRDWRFLIPSVDPGTISDEFRLPLKKEGDIICVRTACSSTNHDISLRTKAGDIIPTVNEILRVIEIDQTYNETELEIYYSNSDEPETPNLYLVVSNNDTIATGDMVFEIIISQM